MADFNFVGVFNAIKENNNQYYEIGSVIRKDFIEEINFEDRKIFINRIPVRMKSDNSRIVEQYDEYLYENDGNTIRAKVKDVLNVGGEYIVPL